MRRGVVCLFLSLAVVWGSPVFAGDYEYELNLGTIATKDTPWGKQLTMFKNTIEKASDDRIKVKLHFGGKMGDEVSMVRQLKRADLQAFAGSTAAIASQVPEVAVFELCGLFKDLDTAYKIVDEKLTKPISEILEANGFKLYVVGENGFRNFAVVKDDFKGIEDLASLKMRSQEAWFHEEMYRALGGNPVQMPVSEVGSGLAQGNIDGFDNTPLYAYAAGWHKYIKTWIVSDHIYQPAMIVYNKDWYDSLPADLQEVVMLDQDVQLKLGRKLVGKMMPKLVENMEAAGVKIVHFTDEQKAEVAEKCKVVHKMFVDKVGGRAQELLDDAYDK